MKRILFKIVLILVAVPILGVLSFAGVEDDLKGNMSKTKCIHSWNYDKSAFRVYFNTELCKKNEGAATLLTVRYVFESNKKKFPRKIEVYNNNGNLIDSYPFERIPSLAK